MTKNFQDFKNSKIIILQCKPHFEAMKTGIPSIILLIKILNISKDGTLSKMKLNNVIFTDPKLLNNH